MASAPKIPELNQPDPPPPPPPNTVRVMVHPRRSAVYQQQVGVQMIDGKEVPVLVNRQAIGGTMIEVSLADAAHMRAHGFLQEATTEEIPLFNGQSSTIYGQETRPALAPTINGDDGTVIRGG